MLGEQQLGKPLTHDNATRQLRAMSGNSVTFYTALSLLNARNGEMQTAIAESRVQFRPLNEREIESTCAWNSPTTVPAAPSQRGWASH